MRRRRQRVRVHRAHGGTFTPMREKHAGLDVVVSRVAAAEPPAPGAPSYLLVHGIGVSSRYFRPLAAELARAGAVHVVDLPGYGAAPNPRRPVSLADHADVVAAVIRSIPVTRPILVGHSMGGQVAAMLAERHPELVGGLVMLAPTMPPGARGAVRAFARLAVDAFREPIRVNALVMADYLFRCGVPYLVRQLPLLLDDALEDRMPRIPVPTLVVHGDRDPIVSGPWARELARRAPDGRFAVVPGPHVVMYSAPRLVAERVVSFARGCG